MRRKIYPFKKLETNFFFLFLFLSINGFSSPIQVEINTSIESCNKNYFIDQDVKEGNELLNSFLNHQDQNTLHIISHGKPGHLLIEGSWLDAQEIAIFLGERKSDVKHINIYGCEFAKGETGREAVSYLQAALGVTISASDDITGVDGDWELEVGKTTALEISNYQYNLQSCAGDVGGMDDDDDFDGDGYCNDEDLDDDNDGILDMDESTCSYQSHDFSSALSGARYNSTPLINTGDVAGAPFVGSQDFTWWSIAQPTNDVNTSTITWDFSPNEETDLIFGFANVDFSRRWFTDQDGNYIELELISDNSAGNQTMVGELTDLGPTNITADAIWDADPNTTGTGKGAAGVVRFKGSYESITMHYDKNPTYTGGSKDGSSWGILREVCDQTQDTDDDGIPDRFDTDSDDDGCSDAIEGGGDFTSADLTGDNNLCADSSCVDSDGVPTNTGSPQEVGDSQDETAISDECPCTDPDKLAPNCDLDGDGKLNRDDIDDDNDGILDAIESPNCFYTVLEAAEIKTVSTTVQTAISFPINANSTAEDIDNVIDGDETTHVSFYNHRPIAGETLFEWETTAPVELSQVHFEHLSGAEIIEDIGAATNLIEAAEAVLQAWDGSAWVNLSATLDEFGVEDPISIPTANQGTYSRYRLLGVGGQIDLGGSVEDILLTTTGNNYIQSKNPKPTCGDDIDGDGIPNHLDTDSDGDGCPDAIEGDENVSPSDLNADGSINSGVDDDGVPTIVNDGGSADDGADQGQGLGDSDSFSTSACNTNAENDVNQTAQGVPVSGNLLQNDTDKDGDAQRVTSITINGQVVTIPDGGSSGPQYIKGVGTIEVNSDGSYTFTPDPDFTGSVPSIPYSIIDTTGAIDQAKLDMNVLPNIPDTTVPPIAVNDTNTVEQGDTVSTNFLSNDSDPEGQAVTLVPNSLTGLDEDGDPLVIPTGTATDAINVYDENGDLAGTAYIDSTTGELVFTADNSFTGEVPFKYTIEDEDDLEDSAEITITVDADDPDTDLYANNDASSGPAAASVNDPAAQQTGNVIDNDNDPEATDVTVTGFTTSDGTMVMPGDTVTLTSGGTIVINADGTYTYNPAPGFVGTEVVEYTIVDENGDVSTATLSVSTKSSKVPPVAIDDTNTVEQGATVSTDFLGNDSDPEGQTVSLVANSLKGLDSSGDPLTIPTGTATDAVNVYDENGNLAGTAYIDSTTGELVFTADTNFTGEAPFEYEVTDTDNLTDTAKITIAVEPDDGENDTVANDDTNSGPLDDPQSGNMLTNDNDPEGDDQSIASITLDTTGDGNLNTITPVAGTAYPIYQTVNGVIAQIGTITVDPDTGAYVYDPIPTFQGTAVVYYTKTDGGDADVTDPATDKATMYLTTVGQAPISLPVELAEFTAEALELDGVLRWTTASESNNSHFEVEHSKNGVDFEFLTNVASKAQDGNSQASLSYSFVDKGAADWRKEEGSTVYYRLKQVDTDGQFAYSPIRLIDFKDVEITSTVFPNPVSNGQAITVQMKDIERVEVFTTGGELVRLVQEPTPVSSTSIDTNDLATGMYIVVVNNKTTMKFIVQ